MISLLALYLELPLRHIRYTHNYAYMIFLSLEIDIHQWWVLKNCICYFSSLIPIFGLYLKYEGAVDEGRRGVSIWDTLISKPGFCHIINISFQFLLFVKLNNLKGLRRPENFEQEGCWISAMRIQQSITITGIKLVANIIYTTLSNFFLLFHSFNQHPSMINFSTNFPFFLCSVYD